MKTDFKSSFRIKRQFGLSLVAMFAVLALAGAAALIAMRSFPIFSEYSAIKKAVVQVEQSGATDISEVRKKWDERAALEYITTLSGKDLKITKTGRGVKIDFEYEKKIPLISNASLVYEFSSAEK